MFAGESRFVKERLATARDASLTALGTASLLALAGLRLADYSHWGYWRDRVRLIATLLIAAVSLAACSSGPALTAFECGEAASIPHIARETSALLPSAGGGRPMTGYPGASASLIAPFNRDLSVGIGLDVNYTHNIAERLSAELALGTIRMGIDIPDDGTVVVTTMGATLQAGHPMGSARWYGGLGLAYWIGSITGSSTDLDNSFALLLTGGIDLPLHLRASLNLELRYMTSKSELSTGEDVDLSAFAARVNYVFLY